MVSLLAAGSLQAQATPAPGGNEPPVAVGTYQHVIRDALSEFDAGNWAEARALFEQAHALRPSARTLRGLGMASFELKNYVRAEQELRSALDETRQPLTAAQRAELTALLQRIERYVGKLVVKVQPETATVLLDGAAIPHEIELELGQHELSVQADGYHTLTRNIAIEGGKQQTLELSLTPVEKKAEETAQVPAPAETAAAAQAPSSELGTFESDYALTDTEPSSSGSVFSKWWFWTAVGVVVAGGVVTAVVLTSKSEREPLIAGDNGKVIEALHVAY